MIQQDTSGAACPDGRLDSVFDADMAKAKKLEVPCHSVTVLSGNPTHTSERSPRVLHTRDLVKLKELVGVPDATVAGRCLVDRDERRAMDRLCRECTDYEDKGKAATTDRPSFADAVRAGPDASLSISAIRSHARSFIYADSSQIALAKPVIEAFYENFEVITWLFPKVVVKSGSVLAFGPGLNYLSASELVIEAGGQVVSTGSLSVRVTGPLRKKTPVVVGELQDLTLALRTAFRKHF